MTVLFALLQPHLFCNTSWETTRGKNCDFDEAVPIQ